MSTLPDDDDHLVLGSAWISSSFVNSFTYTITYSSGAWEVSGIRRLPITQMKRLRLRGVTSLPQGHIAGKQEHQASNPDVSKTSRLFALPSLT